MEKIQFLGSECLEASVHYVENRFQAFIHVLESIYRENEVPEGNFCLARQRSLGNPFVLANWFYGCPQVQGRVDGEKMIFFDDRLVDGAHLEDHPLLNPSFLRDNWSSMRNGALPVSQKYFSALVDLSRAKDSGVRSLSHRNMGRINTTLTISEAKDSPYVKAFLGLSEEERRAYLQAHRTKHGETMSLRCSLDDAEQEAPMGSESSFDYVINLDGSDSLDSEDARLLATPPLQERV